jgi:hypothetical protein
MVLTAMRALPAVLMLARLPAATAETGIQRDFAGAESKREAEETSNDRPKRKTSHRRLDPRRRLRGGGYERGVQEGVENRDRPTARRPRGNHTEKYRRSAPQSGVEISDVASSVPVFRFPSRTSLAPHANPTPPPAASASAFPVACRPPPASSRPGRSPRACVACTARTRRRSRPTVSGTRRSGLPPAARHGSC